MVDLMLARRKFKCVCLFLFYQHKIHHIDSRTPHKCEGSLGCYTSQLVKNLGWQSTLVTATT